jgi:hypothetical protein
MSWPSFEALPVIDAEWTGASATTDLPRTKTLRGR